jgi:lipoate-protein ligase A
MQLLVNLSNDPAYNLALEEYALTRLKRELVILWRNSRAVIIGKNQNAVAEVDVDYAAAHNIAIIRRQSGGGAVFHDLGNVNYTLIKPFCEEDVSDYRAFTAPLRAFLAKSGVATELSGRNDLTIGGSKFSGNAQAAHGEWIMHHGCILFASDFAHLAAVLRPNPAKIASKGIKSVRSRVTNLAEHMPEELSADEFFEQLVEHFRESCDGEYLLSTDEKAAVWELVRTKYGTWEWNIGHSPHYGYSKCVHFPFGTVELNMDVADGVIEQAHITGDFFGLRPKDELERALAGVRHQREALYDALSQLELEDFIQGAKANDLLELFWS